MRKLFYSLVFSLVAVFFANDLFAQGIYVRGYTRQDGTYVQPHYRSAPDGNIYNNWSTRGNVNPYTGEPGRVNPERSFQNQSPYNSNRNFNSYGNSIFSTSPSRKRSFLDD